MRPVSSIQFVGWATITIFLFVSLVLLLFVCLISIWICSYARTCHWVICLVVIFCTVTSRARGAIFFNSVILRTLNREPPLAIKVHKPGRIMQTCRANENRLDAKIVVNPVDICHGETDRCPAWTPETKGGSRMCRVNEPLHLCVHV